MNRTGEIAWFCEKKMGDSHEILLSDTRIRKWCDYLLLLLKVNLDLDQYLDEIEIKIQIQLYTKVHIMHIVNFLDNRQYDIFSPLIFSVIKYLCKRDIMLCDSLKRSTQSRLAENFFRTINVHYLLPGSAEGV